MSLSNLGKRFVYLSVNFPDYLEVATAVVVSVCIDIVFIFFHILVLQEEWVLTEIRIPLQPVLGGVRIVALVVLINRLNKTDSADF